MIAQAAAGTPSVEHINPFIAAAVNALAIMAHVSAQRTHVSIKTEDNAHYDVSGVIGLAGEIVGSVVLSFPADTARQIVAKFLDAEKPALDAEAHSAIGELINMVAGGAKKDLSARGLGFKIGIPTVVTGAGHQVARPRHGVTVCVHFTCDEGDFVLEVCLKSATGSPIEN